MKRAIEQETTKLVGLKLRSIGRASNLLWLGFGDLIIRRRKGKIERAAKFALHVQCAWRITKANTIYLGSSDFYKPSNKWDGNFDVFEWDIKGNNRFDEQAQKLIYNGEEELLVTRVESDVFGGLKLYLSDHYVLEIFPNSSIKDDYSEFWRLFNRGDNSPHFVVSGKGIEN